LASDHFEDEKNAGEINIQTLILWGLILCAGDPKLKARVFYDVLQDSLQETISANDKDFKESFGKLINLATKIAYQFESEYSGLDKTSSDRVTDDLIDEVAESFLDEVFGANAKLPRREYMDTVALK
jgi:hypothetical protein